MKYPTIREEELKNKISEDYFWMYDCTQIIGNVDFCVAMHQSVTELSERESLLWAEAKKDSADIYKSFVQLILTIGKARTFDTYLPPAFLGAFDAKKMAFLPYNEIQEIFYINDFNWNVTPSKHETKEFKLIYEKVKNNIDNNSLLFDYIKDDRELKKFIKENFVIGKFGVTKTKIDKNNFITIYNKWFQTVKPTIAVDWSLVKKVGIIDADFYLADLLSSENQTLKEKLYVLLNKDYYELDRKIDEVGLFTSRKTTFVDKQKAHKQFWNRYERPPKEEYWDYIVNRRDLLVPQDVRERKGSFFTPQIWVELSQKYLADVLGEDWQDEYYIWDCAAGTGNLLNGLTNKNNIFASTLDRQDVDVIKDRIENGANLLENNVFQFDFLNDDFSKLPKKLQNIINDPEKRKKLVIYINPPYVEASSYGVESVPQVANETKIFNKYKADVGAEALNEVFAQFFIRIYKEIPDSKMAFFSTPKYITSEKFTKFRNHFQAKYKKGFICKSDTFDNVAGKFPIGFFIWDLYVKVEIKQVKLDIFLSNKNVNNYWKENTKSFYVLNNNSIADWRASFYCFGNNPIGYMIIVGPSMQSNNNTFITSSPADSYIKKGMVANIEKTNLIKMSVYLAIRHCIETDWLNNKDQFLYPNKKWEKDTEFQNDCLAFTLFHGQNRISSKDGVNHWIPFTEEEVNAKASFESNFMSNFIKGKLKPNGNGNLLEKEKTRNTPLEFSTEAKEVLEAGKNLWKYYHSQEFTTTYGGVKIEIAKYNENASLYDIKEHFQGRSDKGRMNNKSQDETYTDLLNNLREKLEILAEKIEPKVYKYGFLNL